MYLTTTRRPALLGPDFAGLRRLNRVLDERPSCRASGPRT